MNLKVTKNIQQLVAQRRAKKIETVRNEVITVNLKEARAKLAETTGTKQIVEKPEDTPQAPEHATASLSPMGEATTAPAPVDADVSSGTGLESVDASTFFKAFVDTADVSSGTGLESVGSPIPPTDVDAPDVPVKKPTKSRSRSKSKSKK